MHAMRRRTVTIKNEPRIITAPPTMTKAKTSDSNIPWGVAIKNVIPVVYADAPDSSLPPSTMKFTDLPLYVPILPLCKTEKTKDHEIKYLHKKVYPYVKECREQLFDTIANLTDPISCIMCNVICNAKNRKNKFKLYMRHPDNLQMRKAVFVSGTVAGFALGARKNNVTGGVFWGVVGALFTGWLCFPVETDIAVREISYKIGTILAVLLSKFCNKTYSLENDRLPCFKNICVPTHEYYIGNKDCEQKKVSKNEFKSKNALVGK